MNIKQKFKVYCSTNINDTVNKALVESLVEKEEPLILEAVASSNSVDLDGDYMTNECLEDMKKQAVGLNIFLDHDHIIDKIVGSVTEVVETSSDIFKIKFSVLPNFEWYITELLDNDINLGLSIGASVLDFEETDTGWKINKVKLVEISIVGIPSNWDTFGTIKTSKELGVVTAKCFNGACKQIIDNLELSDKKLITKDLEDGPDLDDDEVITEKEVVDLINEAMIQLKNEIITEIVAEFNLDGKRYDKPDSEQDLDDSESKNDETNSSNDEDKEKNLDMEKEEIIELIKEHTLTTDMVKDVVVDVLKDLKEEDVDTAAPTIVEEEVELTKEKEDLEVEDVPEPVIEKDAEEVKTEESSEETTINVNVEEDIDLEEIKKKLREELKKEIEEELLKSLAGEREPVATEQPKLDESEVTKDADEKSIKKSASNIMSARKMAEHLLGY